MGVANKLSVILFAFIILAGFFAPNPASCSELVGIVPFTNQRDNPANDWLGFYIQARLQSYLAEGCDCSFLSLSIIRLWQHQANRTIPVTIENSVLIMGSYQQVLEQGILDISVKRFSPLNEQKEFKISFAKDELELDLDLAFKSIAEWIDPGFKQMKPFNYPRHEGSEVGKIFEFRKMLYAPKTIPELSSLQQLKTLVNSNSPQEYIADLAEGMIYIAHQLPTVEKQPLLNEAERILRSAAMQHIKNSRIHSLLAEVFFLTGKESSWVIKTAEQAINLDKNNSLALLLLILSETDDRIKTRESVNKLNDINPWIWPEQSEGEDFPQFQKGIFNTELISLQGFLL